MADLKGFTFNFLAGKGLPSGVKDVSQRPRPVPAPCRPLYDMTQYIGGYQPVARVIEEARSPAPHLGDLAISYVMTQNLPADDEGPAAATQFAYTVIRSGTTVATFFSMPPQAGTPARIPQQVITAQINKLA
ncbi:hypothetical protein OG552_15290 [Streptomyces sp. NBC_01476]|uniref:hypothetical protein n=1 Tax=Streptomyces sp. NBC_01476 TaxID=2903881 RepID=UPI002E3230A3|nr:hypothetical protein [Streptomyces sp. NBC_01476]